MRVASDRQGNLCLQPGENGVGRDSCVFRERILADPKPWDLLGVSELTWHLAKWHGVPLIEYLNPSAFARSTGTGSARRVAQSAANRRAAARRKAHPRRRRHRCLQAAAERFAATEFNRYMLTASPEELAEQT